ncbi:hypothetical protein SBRY_30776 [Actinacidiphila bryophytorum]|uniref:Uncharacterized protein n=1 Tax=Actinacidiphila bryophytorum TaxID=1436133 RepID=A0A9W4H1N8_9ACTN|nr:hypothetical protein SBRY_30776 [Actinacidiphila bryophytorum]
MALRQHEPHPRRAALHDHRVRGEGRPRPAGRGLERRRPAHRRSRGLTRPAGRGHRPTGPHPAARRRIVCGRVRGRKPPAAATRQGVTPCRRPQGLPHRCGAAACASR